MTTLNARKGLAFLAAVSLAGLSTTAGAADISFRYHASDLASPAALYQRMAARAEAACATSGRKGLWSVRAQQDCAADLLDDFVAGAASPSLTAVHQQSSGERLADLR